MGHDSQSLVQVKSQVISLQVQVKSQVISLQVQVKSQVTKIVTRVRLGSKSHDSSRTLSPLSQSATAAPPLHRTFNYNTAS